MPSLARRGQRVSLLHMHGHAPLPPLAIACFWRTMRRMHEMSLTVSLLDIVREEMQKHGATRLLMVRVRHGALANVVPEALAMAFEVLTVGTDFDGAALEMIEEPVRLVCGGCRKEFEPVAVATAVFAPCPLCGEEIGHVVLSGKELYIDHIEVE